MKGQSFPRRLSYALKGLRDALRREASLKVHALAVLFWVAYCFWARPPAIWIAIFTLVSALVIGLELINTAVESIADRLHPDRHPEIGFAKDVLAGAVLIASLAALAIFILSLVVAPPF